MMKILIIEDELPAARHLQDLLQSYGDDMELEGPIDSNAALLRWFRQNEPPDLVFSDIELLDGPVFEALAKLELHMPIIFTTAYDQYTLDAFETNGISYLLKPFDGEQLSKAMSKFHALKKSFIKSDNRQLIEQLRGLQLKGNPSYKKRLAIKLSKGIYLLKVEEISCIRIHAGLPHAFKKDGKKFPVSQSLTDLQELLNPDFFFRLNRSEFVNVDFIEKIAPYFNDRLAVSVAGQKEVLISSAARTPEFRQWLNGR